MLQPLSQTDIAEIAASYGFDPDAFQEAVRRAKVLVLAQQPLTLEMLLRVYARGGALPTSRSELFANGMQELASERTERLEGGTAGDFSTTEILEAAERLACYALLSAKEAIDLGDSPSASSLGRAELLGLPSGSRALEYNLLRAVGRSGLCDSDSPRRFGFAHRNFAEYLAGRRLARLLPHQSKALLSSASGWQAGVGAPLRETAAFAAMHSQQIAAWVAQYDPEVIGLSDVADEQLRRHATLNLLEKFRRHELTDTQLIRGGIELSGFQYLGAEADLKPVLREREHGCNDVLECAVTLIDNWELTSMSDDLAGLMLDATAPLEARRSAGYVLMRIGTPESRKRLRPLIANHEDDSELDLKGLAIRSNWPGELTTSELLAAISTRAKDGYSGAYQGFLFELDRSGFNAQDARLEGLKWAIQFQGRDSDIESQGRIARRIAIASVDEFHKDDISDALADVLLTAAENNAESPLQLAPQLLMEDEVSPLTASLEMKQAARRKLIDSLMTRAGDESDIWWLARKTPGLIVAEDFPWLMVRATTDTIPFPVRERYAVFARTLPWQDRVENIDAWLAVRMEEPIASRFPYPLYIQLGSEEAAKARKWYEDAQRSIQPQDPKKLSPPPRERVKQVLSLCETKDTNFFLRLSRELTLDENSSRYGFSRFLIHTPGWRDADADTRLRIVQAAKRFLVFDTDEPEKSKIEPWNRIAVTHIAAMWLLLETDLQFLDSQPPEWWQRWCWYILRELHPGLSGEHEQKQSKLALLQFLYSRARSATQMAIEEWACMSDSQAINRLSSLLPLLSSIDDDELDTRLCNRLASGEIAAELIGDIGRFVLSRNASVGIQVLTSFLDPHEPLLAEERAVRVCIALMQVQFARSWSIVHDLLQRRPDLAPTILGEFAHRDAFAVRSGNSSVQADLRAEQIGELVGHLLEAFPPPSDPQRNGAAYHVAPDDSARHLRDQMISWLGDQRDIKAVEALRSLERRFGDANPWLRRPRARAEQGYRESTWAPIPTKSVAELVAAESKRLIRSEHDAVEGVIEAITVYAHQLRHGNPNDVEDFWNYAVGHTPTPKNEERLSDKVCSAIRHYFGDYAVTADREVQISRRILSKADGGTPGSELDVICRIPAVGAVNMSSISIPVELKWSHNPEARTGLNNQLVNRYMDEMGALCGVFVVAWAGMTKTRSSYRQQWASLSEAREDLAKQARVVSEATGFDIQAIVIDVSLPTVIQRTTGRKMASNQKKSSVKREPSTGPKARKKPVKAKDRNKGVKKKPKRQRGEK